jgi:hypothetical protein
MTKTYEISITDYTETHVTREGDPNEQFDGDDVEHSHSITGFKLGARSGDITLCFEPKFNTDYFLLYYLWSTGDSFSHESGKIEFIDLYRNRNEAEVAKKKIEKHYEEYKSGNEVVDKLNIKFSNRVNADLSVSYFGYFESLESVIVEAIRREK